MLSVANRMPGGDPDPSRRRPPLARFLHPPLEHAMLASVTTKAVPTIGPTLQPVPRFEQHASSDLLAYTEMLALPMAELEGRVDREVEQNPALERLEPLTCPRCGDLVGRCSCRAARRRTGGIATAEIDAVIPDEPTPSEVLLAELRPLVSAEDIPVLDYLVGSLDDHGLCDAGAEEIAAHLSVPLARVECVRRLLRRHGPAGIGAVDLRECLLLQLDRLVAEPPADLDFDLLRLARAIVEHHLDLFASRRYAAVADSIGASREQVAAAAELVRTRLRPYPLLDSGGARRTAPRALPDVIVHALGEPGEYGVELLEPHRVRVAVSADYERLVPLSTVGRTRANAQVTQARAFLHRLERRWETILAVAEVVVDRQRAYIAGGARHLAPLTRAEVADAVGIHESTAGRAISGRFVLLPGGRLVAFSRFFERAQGPCAALAQLIAEESQPRPDATLAEELARIGFPLSRRTVAKYRDRLGIPPHTAR